MQLAPLLAAIDAEADAERASTLERYFQVRPGGYGEGDRFVGVQLSRLRVLVRPYHRADVAIAEFDAALGSPVHEHRLAALVLMAAQSARAARPSSRDDARLTDLARCYLRNTDRIDNWDLVDCSAPQVIGGWLEDRPRDVLHTLVASSSVWERRIALVSTHRFIRAGDGHDTIALAAKVLDDPHDLVHKAAGWMLREVGKRVDGDLLTAFLDEHAPAMPRTMLRYATEHLPAQVRLHYRQPA